MINADANAKNWLTKESVMKYLFGIKIIVNVSVIDYVMLENISIMRIVSVEKTNW